MPWREVKAVEQRLEFVREYGLGLDSMAELARRYGVTPKTGYKWVARYDRQGGSVAELSRRPRSNARAIAGEVIERVIAARRQHPTWGAAKLLAWLAARGGKTRWPKRSTVCDLLRRHGYINPRRRRSRPTGEGGALTAPLLPNELWTIDFKGQFRLGDRTLCYPLTLRDAASRYLLRCDACGAPATEVTRQHCEQAFREYGLPERIGSDNGSPFGSTGLRRLSRLAVWWIRLGIGIVRIRPGHPEDNGSHEQFHAVLKAETARPPAATVTAQERRFRTFRRAYNEERPHEAHAQQPPATVYVPSPRMLPPRLPEMVYPGHVEIRRVLSNGCVKWRQQVVYLSHVLVDEDVGWEETDDGVWAVSFGPVLLGRFDERLRRFQPAAGT